MRYVHVIEAIAKEKENDYYLYLAEEATKGVKQAAIEALRHSKENVEYLLRLVKTERGANKKAAQYALSFLESPEIFSYWEKEIKKSPDRIIKTDFRKKRDNRRRIFEFICLWGNAFRKRYRSNL